MSAKNLVPCEYFRRAQCHTRGTPAWHALDMETRELCAGNFTVVDLETTGLSHRDDGVVEIACLRLEDGRIVDHLVSFVDPEQPIPAQASVVHGIVDADVCDAPTIEELRGSLLTFTAGSTIVAHNAAFDLGFLPSLSDRPRICSMRLAMHLIDAASYKNEALRELLGVQMPANHGPAHRAYNDAAVTAAIFSELLARYSRTSHPQSIAGLIELISRPAMLGRFAFGTHRGVDIDSVPTSYLQGIVAEGFENWPDVRATAEYELARRAAHAATLQRAV